MKWCVDFPEETILVVRPCLKRICLDNKPAAKLLSILLYRYSIRKEAKEDAENMNEAKAANGEIPDQDTSFRIYRKQSQIVADTVDEMDEKTLHDVAVPALQLLGYLDIEEHPGMHCYIVHLDRVKAALAAYKQGAKQLEAFLKENSQLEKILISVQLEKVLINKKNFQLALEKSLIGNRKISNCKRGRKPRPQEALEGISEPPQISIEIDSKISTKEREDSNVSQPPHFDASASVPPSFSSSQEEISTNHPQGASDDLCPTRFEHYSLTAEHSNGFCSRLAPEHEGLSGVLPTHDIQSVGNAALDTGASVSPSAEAPPKPTQQTQSVGSAALGADLHIPQPAGASPTPAGMQGGDKPNRSVTQANVPTEKKNPPVMPTGSAPWCSETMLQVFEARRGRCYPNGAKRKADRIRDRELEACQELYKMDDLWTEDTARNIRRLDMIIDHQETRKNNWWIETNGRVMPHQLVDKDRVHTMFDELMRLQKLRIVPPPDQQASEELPVIGVSGLPIHRYSGPPLKVLSKQERLAEEEARKQRRAELRRAN